MLIREDAVDNRRVQRMHAGETSANRAQRIYDISRYGCQIESNDLADGASGQFVEIDFGSVVTRAIIRWSDRARLGVEFARPLGSREVDALLAESAPIRLRRL
ncbi:PilZ domain-containing protein [Novosphingobium sp.]|uniref:PilZ domain-containing protein n=1 Tax=Novosphingobium sp. TaxID=1874826 RepID=UPI002606E0A9|nr:PilZ domain-containing protein [Novosphingobium sp.]